MVNSNKKKLALVFIGAPGSGKGTQGEIFEKNSSFKRYVMSDLIRMFVKEDNVLLDKINHGVLLSSDDIFKIFREGFGFEDKVLIDGMPRTLDQAYWLYGFLFQHGYDVLVVYLKVDENKLIDRILLRSRKDDKKEIFEFRLKEFDKVRDFVLDVFKGKIIEVDGDRTIEVIGKDILSRVKRRVKDL